MLNAGFDLNEPYLAHLLQQEAIRRLSNLRAGKWRQPDSGYFVGVPDQTGELEAHQVAACLPSSPLVSPGLA